ncbi:MAG: alpha amylase C-terminal domain-containing protein [Bacteroidales bacterium]|nr:alpha amylase C-terminal domain-containing protein [Bacteroidales bacterium]
MKSGQATIIDKDPWLIPYREIILRRHRAALLKEELLCAGKRLQDFATGHLYYGLHKTPEGWVFREWAPNATAIYLVGDFSAWQKDHRYALKRLSYGNWEIVLPFDTLKHGDKYKLLVCWPGGSGYRIPSYTRYAIQDPVSLVFDATVWDPAVPYQWQCSDFIPPFKHPIIYEAHVGMSSEEAKISSFREFTEQVLPRIKKLGYNTIQLMAIQEHPYYGSFGYHVSNFFAVSSRFGTPDDLKALIDTAHQMGIAVIMDLVHSHAVKNELEGLGNFDGTPYQYFHTGHRRYHVAWDSLCFNYGKNEVLHFLLSNCQFWLKEYHFDGFRFDGVTSMIYLDHGLGKNFTHYDMYFDGNQDEDAIVYLMLANKLVHEINPNAITIAEEMSGMPGLAATIHEGGYGFDYRLAMGVPDYWIKLVKERPDEHWPMGELYHELTTRRPEEKTISYAESHDQALVGDKTLMFRMADKEMYFHMSKNDSNLIIDRAIALHKMIRLITLTTAGAGYLNFMGNEFGHPEWIDFPREGNNWSYQYARRQWSLVDNPNLKYHYLNDFDRCMIEWVKDVQIFDDPYPTLHRADEENKILAFSRKNFLFLFNFHPTQSFTDYSLPVPSGKYKVVLTTDDPAFGGFNRVDKEFIYYTSTGNFVAVSKNNWLRIYLPNRTAIVLHQLPIRKVYEIVSK